MIKSIITALAFVLFAGAASAQQADPALNIIILPDTLEENTTDTIEISVLNIGVDTIALSSLEVSLSTGDNTEILGVATNSDSRWTQNTLSSGTGNSITLRNTAGGIDDGDAHTIYIIVSGEVPLGTDTIEATIAYIPGPNSNIPGSLDNSEQGNDPDNDLSITTVAIKEANPLNAGLVRFTGAADGCEASLTWIMADEVDVLRYTVEQSTNGRDFRAVATVDARGDAEMRTYEHHAVQPQPLAYYRLRFIERDGGATFSNTVAVRTACPNGGLAFFPNPTRNTVTITGTAAGEAVTVYNAVGQAVMQTAATEGRTQLNLGHLATGQYRIRVVSGGIERATATVTKLD